MRFYGGGDFMKPRGRNEESRKRETPANENINLPYPSHPLPVV